MLVPRKKIGLTRANIKTENGSESVDNIFCKDFVGNITKVNLFKLRNILLIFHFRNKSDKIVVKFHRKTFLFDTFLGNEK